MGKKCFVPRCNTGYKSCVEKWSLFSAPKDEQRLDAWRRAIPRKDRLLQATDHVCEKHFEPQLVCKTWTAEYKGHVLVSAPRRASLANDAVPTRFPDCPPYLSKTTKTRKRPAERQPLPPSKKKCSASPRKSARNDTEEICGDDENCTRQASAIAFDGVDRTTDTSEEETPHLPGPSTSASPVCSPFRSLFADLPRSFLPSIAWGYHLVHMGQVQSVVFSQLERTKKFISILPDEACTYSASSPPLFITSKMVEIDEKMQVRTALMNRPFSVTDLHYAGSLSTFDDVKEFLQHVDNIKLCSGGPNKLEYPQVVPQRAYLDSNDRWRHNKCSVILDDGVFACHKCTCLSNTLRMQQNRRQKQTYKYGAALNLPSQRSKEKLAALHRAKYALKRSKNRLLNRCKILSTELAKSKDELQKLSEEELEGKLLKANLQSTQMTVVRECIAAAKLANKKNRRYTEDWLLMCLLLHIRSPSAYSFLRDNDVLPLPCVTTVRRYLSMIKVKCGFDKRFFAAFKKKLATKDTFQRHGILVFDEMQVRKEISVHSKSMMYTGFADYGETSVAQDDFADHGLVFTFRSFGDNYSQPIAVFASKGPTKGAVLAQLVLKAIFLLEEAGALVDAVVCDGASTNRSMWKEFGVSGALNGTKHYFTHPVDDTRKVFVFSDAPHLLKCVRNRLHAQKILLVNGQRVQWAHFDRLFVEDTKQPGSFRVCPKITFSHINPSNTEKMRVKLATQLFSRSVAKGLEFYSRRKTEGLQDVKATMDFTLRFNDLFDALNRNNPKEGISFGSKDLRVLASSLHWLNNWEKEVVCGKTLRSSLLTCQTAEGLRVTILSTLEITRYLLKECQFKYVLTGKFNQDVLERFFGIIRQAGGQDDHPSMPTFLQLYNMLSVYSLLKPLKFGNCEVEAGLEKSAPVLTLNGLKIAFDSGEQPLAAVKEKIGRPGH